MISLDPPPTITEEFTFHWRNWLSFLYNFLQVEDWREIGDTGQPAFENSWVDYAGTGRTPAFYKDPLGVVHLRGEAKSGTNGTAIFTLPADYFTGDSLTFSNVLVATTTMAKIVISTTGEVIPDVGTTSGCSLEGISFRV